MEGAKTTLSRLPVTWKAYFIPFDAHCHYPLGSSASSLRSLLILFVEIDYWERLLLETPHYVMNVAERAEDLRILRENLLLVARDYNR